MEPLQRLLDQFAELAVLVLLRQRIVLANVVLRGVDRGLVATLLATAAAALARTLLLALGGVGLGLGLLTALLAAFLASLLTAALGALVLATATAAGSAFLLVLSFLLVLLVAAGVALLLLLIAGLTGLARLTALASAARLLLPGLLVLGLRLLLAVLGHGLIGLVGLTGLRLRGLLGTLLVLTVAALLDLGADRSVLDRVLKSLKVSGFETKISRVVKSGIDACDFDVVLDKEHENHDHDMEYLHGHHHKGHENNHFYDHNHAHEDEAEHFHSHEHNHAHGAGSAQDHHHHEHRGIKEITYIIEHSAMTENAKKIALRIFEILAEAESKAHNVPVDQVHFHEVGAVDSIVDIVSVAVCLDNLDVTEVIVPVLCEGRGTVRCQHGILPIPVPAVANIVSANHLYLKMTEVEGELVTPTGAAIVAAVKTKDKLPETFEIQKIGIGAGKRQYECPGILRAMIISQSAEIDEEKAQKAQSRLKEEIKQRLRQKNSKTRKSEII